MRAVTTDEKTPVYAQMEEQSITIATLEKGQEFDLGRVVKRKNVVWVEVKLDSGSSGYINGNAKIFAIKKVELLLDNVNIYAEPSSTSEVIKTINRGEIFETLRVEKQGEEHWVRVRDLKGNEGYIAGNTRIRIIPANSKLGARKTILFGLGLIAVGAVLTAISNMNNNQATTYYLSLGFLLFGFLQLMQGGMQYYQAVRLEKKEKQAKGEMPKQ